MAHSRHHRRPSTADVRRILGLTSRARFMPNCGNCGQPINPVTGDHRPGQRCALARVDEPIAYRVTDEGRAALARFDSEVNDRLRHVNDDPNSVHYD